MSKSKIKLEIFEFLLNGYSSNILLENAEEYKTMLINDKTSDSCPTIDVEDSDGVILISREKTRTCDYISGTLKKLAPKEIINKLPLIEKTSSIYFEISFKNIQITSQDLIQFMRINGAKKASFQTVDINSIQNMRALYNIDNVYSVLSNVSNILKIEFPDKTKINEVEKGEITYIKWIEPKKEENIILIGDIHGSFSTLIRHLLRFRKQNIIDRNGKVREGYHIIFLGDLVDRGVYGFETLMIIYILKINNRTQIILNRGNHEELETNKLQPQESYDKAYKFESEIIYKFGEKISSDYMHNTASKSIHKLFNDVMLWQSSAIIVRNPFEHNLIFLAHGGLPYDFKDNNKLPDEFTTGILSESDFIIGDKYGKSIRWNDIYNGNETINNHLRIPQNIIDLKNPIIETIKIIGKNIINEASKLGITFIVRGHQDSYYNTKIISQDGTNDWISIREIDKNMVRKCKGSIYTVSLQDNNVMINEKVPIPNYLPVVTISTNTDQGRNLTRDSYAILQFNDETRNVACSSGGGYKTKFYKYTDKLHHLFIEI